MKCRLFCLTFMVLVAAGCTSRNADVAPMANPMLSANNHNGTATFSKPIESPLHIKNSEVAMLETQLETGTKTARMAGCERLGVLSRTSSGYEAINLLSKTMREDPSMDVRIAATNALGGIEDPSATEPLNGLVVGRKKIFEKTSRLAILRDIWR